MNDSNAIITVSNTKMFHRGIEKVENPAFFVLFG